MAALAGIGTVLVGALVAVITGQVARAQLTATVGTALVSTAQQIADLLDREMYERWRDVEFTAGLRRMNDPKSSVEDRRDLLNELKGTYRYYSWIGFTDTTGTIIAGSDGLLEGESVAARPWFIGGLTGMFVGDVRDAVLLARVLEVDPNTPLRFVDFAVPVKAPDGTLLGVLGAHLSWEWARDLTSSFRVDNGSDSVLRDLDVMIVNRDGRLLMSLDDVGAGAVETLPVVDPELYAPRLANDNPTYWLSEWPDGVRYAVAAVSDTGYEAYPGLGWTVVVRQTESIALAPASLIQAPILLVGLAAGVVVAALVWVATGRLMRSLLQVVQAAELAASGVNLTDLPVHSRLAEVSQLSSALTHMMHELEGRKHASSHDFLTGLANRAAFESALQETLTRGVQVQIAVAIVDLDSFKPVNDKFGHAAGDAVLRVLARRFADAVRGHGLLARLGWRRVRRDARANRVTRGCSRHDSNPD
ncbi:MAG: GGDEF domain-containing protein [Chloroflexi bacterium]|nr:GGDEF domain-containing protein [Chloroflexota bacterium]